MSADDPITLVEACKLFPMARLTVSALRAEHSRGRLNIFRLGRRDYTTEAEMREMVRRCQTEDRRRGPKKTTGPNGPVDIASAQAALRQTVLALKKAG